MAVAKSPAMPLYGKDAWSDERFLLLSWDAQGLFWRLAFLQWMEGSIPDDLEAVVDIVGKARQTRSLWPVMLKFFIPVPDSPGRLYNPITSGHREKMLEKRQQQEAGAASTNGKRWGNRTGDSTRGMRLGDARRIARHTPEEWETLLAAFHGFCAKCLDGPLEHLAKDHITPLALGGSDGIGNLQPLCQPCNLKKGGDCTDYRITFCGRLAIKNPSLELSLSDVEAIGNAVATCAPPARARAANAKDSDSLGSDSLQKQGNPPESSKVLTPQQEAVKRVFDALEEHTTGFLLPDGGRIAKWISTYGVDAVVSTIANEGIRGNLDGRNPSYLQQCVDSHVRRGNGGKTNGNRRSGYGAGLLLDATRKESADALFAECFRMTPRKEGEIDARAWFDARIAEIVGSGGSDDDLDAFAANLEAGIHGYIRKITEERTEPKFIMKGSNLFINHADFIDYKPLRRAPEPRRPEGPNGVVI